MKILLIRFSSIGDIVLTSPVVRCVKQQLKDAEVHFLVKKSFSTVIEHNPYIDKRFFFEDDEQKTIGELKKEKYDVVIDLQKNFRSFRIRRALGVKSFSFDKQNFKKWLLVNFKINLLPKIHIVDRYMKAVETLGVTNDEQGLDYFISQNDEKALNEIPQKFRNNYIAWVIGAKHFTKRLPIEKMKSIAEKINQPIILLGGPEDAETGGLLAGRHPGKIFNACGKFSLNQSASIIKHANKVISHDTGLMHIAAAFQKEVISIWGNTIPQFGMFPYYGANAIPIVIGNQTPNFSTILEVNGLSCRPCTKIGFTKCPKGHFKCMRLIDESIFEKL